MTTNDLLEYEIYPNLNKAEALAELKPQDKGDYLLLTCPNCEKREAFIYKNGYAIKCNRINDCGYTASLWDYVKEKKSLSQQDTLKELASYAGIELSDNQPINKEELAIKQKRLSAYEEFIKVCKEELTKSKEAKDYLSQRGFTLEEAETLDIGYYPAVNTFASNTNIKSIDGILSKPWEKRIIGLWRDGAGQAITVWGRDITGEAERKYYYLYGTKKDRPFGIDKCYQKEVIAVEGIIDALSLQKSGIKNVIATGQNTVSKDQLEALSKNKITSITLNFDNDEAGYKGIETAIEKLEARGIKTYVIEPSQMGVKDPDEYIRTKGIDAYKDLLNKAQRGVEWKITRIIGKYDLSTSKGKDTALDEGISVLNAVKDPVIYNYGIDALSSSLSLPRENIESLCMDAVERTEQEKISKEYQGLLVKANSGEIQIDSLLDSLSNIQGRQNIREKDIEFLNMDKVYEEGKHYTERDIELGIGAIDKEIKIMAQELIIIGARPSHGKSTFAYNLLLNLMDKDDPEKAYLFFNLDVPLTVLISRLATIWAMKHRKKQYAYKDDVLKHFQTGNFPEEIQDALTVFGKWGENKRLAVIDKPNYTIEQLTGHAERLAQEKPIGAIFIDYAELIGSSKRQDTEELRVSYIVNQLRITAQRLGVPIFLLAQMNRASTKEKKDKTPRLENLRYSGRQEQEATTVIGLYDKEREKIDEEDAEDTKTDTILEVIPLKNRGGITNKKIKVSYDKVSGYISDNKNKGDGSSYTPFK